MVILPSIRDYNINIELNCVIYFIYPKIIAVGGGGGMASSAGGGNSALNSYARTTWACDSYCGGGGASPQTNSVEVVEYNVFSPTNITSLNQIGFGDNTLTTGGFFGGTGYNNSNYSATGGGAGVGGAGGDYIQLGGQETMRGGAGGLGVYDTFTGATVGYGGGGCGGHATTQAIQTSLFGGGSGNTLAIHIQVIESHFIYLIYVRQIIVLRKNN